MRTLWHDLRYGTRMLLKSPGFTVVAVLSLALGIGANTTVFSVVNALLLRPLPVKEPERLVRVFTKEEATGRYNHSSYPDYEYFRDQNEVFSGLAAHFYWPVGLKAGDQAEVGVAQLVSGNYFSVLGVKAFMGRTVLPEEDKTPGGHPVAVLSHQAWKRRFAADPRVVGKTVLINSYPFEVIGVAPEGFTGLNSFLKPDVWVPVTMAGQVLPFPITLSDRYSTWLMVVGRLKPGVSLEQAQAATAVLAANLREQYPDSNRGRGVELVEANRNRVGWLDTTDPQERMAALLMGVVGLVLLIACFNVANLHLAKATGRHREIALRLSLGASRGRILRQLLTESVLLSLVAGAAGLLIAVWALDLLKSLPPPALEFPIDVDLSLDQRVLGFTMLLSLLSGLVFGVAPATQMARSAQYDALKDQALSLSRGRGKSRLQNSLVIAQVALSLVLLISAGLFLRSLENTLALDPGFDRHNGILVPVNLGFGQYDAAKGRQFYRQLIDRVESLPGVRSAALAADVPLGQLHLSTSVDVVGYQPRPEERMVMRRNVVGPGYFETLGIPILMGRSVDERDTEQSKPVAVINETMARRYWPGEDPIGRKIRAHGRVWEVVGVMEDGKYDALDEAPQPYVCLPMRQLEFLKRFNLHVKTAGDPRGMMPAVLRVIRQLDPSLPVSNMMTMDQFLEQSVEQTSGPVKVVGMFGLLALVLAMVGVYGLMSFAVSQRTQEFGIRTALGASRRAILRLVLSQGLKTTVIGVVIGLAAAFAVTRMLSSFLYEVSPLDPLVFAGVSLTLAAVALLACYIPARWAARVDPMKALRYE